MENADGDVSAEEETKNNSDKSDDSFSIDWSGISLSSTKSEVINSNKDDKKDKDKDKNKEKEKDKNKDKDKNKENDKDKNKDKENDKDKKSTKSENDDDIDLSDYSSWTISSFDDDYDLSNLDRRLQKQPPTPKTPTSPERRLQWNRRVRQKKIKINALVKQRFGLYNTLLALTKGPIIGAHHASKMFRFYESGIYSGEECDKLVKRGRYMKINHSTVLVGYKLDPKDGYFLFKNAWGKDWGDGGYYKMKLYKKNGQWRTICGIERNNFTFEPIVVD